MTDLESSYCKVCINKGVKYPLGVICKLTQEKPQFGQDCRNYDFDTEEYQKLKNNRILYFIDINKKGNSFGNQINMYTVSYEKTQISEKGKTELSSKLPRELEIRNSIGHFFTSHITPCLIFIIGIGYYLINNEVDSLIKLIGYLLQAVFVGVIVWAIIKINDKKSKITLNEKGIKLEGQNLIVWRDVLLTQIKRKEEKTTYEYLCISQLSTMKEIEINIDKLDILGWQLGHYIEMYKQKYQKL